MLILQGSRFSNAVGVLKRILCTGRRLWTRGKAVYAFLETGEPFVDTFDLLLASFEFSTKHG
jgi:hypothetical protein